jgi:hypothetical protein
MKVHLQSKNAPSYNYKINRLINQTKQIDIIIGLYDSNSHALMLTKLDA